MPPVVIGGAIAAAGAVGAAAIGSSASKSAAQSAQQSADQAAQVQRETYAQNQQNLTPFMDTGTAAMGNINALLGVGGDPAVAQKAFDTYRNSTGYDFRVNEGLKAINSGYAGAGTLKSGAAMKGIADYGQGMASQEFGNYLGALGNQQALGLSGASAIAGVGQNYANSLGNIYQQNGANQANAALARGQNAGQAVNSLATIGAGIFGQTSGNSVSNTFNPGLATATTNALLSAKFGA